MDGIIHNFVQTHKPSLCILSPGYNGYIHSQYMKSFIETLELFKEFHIPLSIEHISYTDSCAKAKNNLLAKGMNKHNITHFMFIDAFVEWQPLDIIKLLLNDKFIIAGICPNNKMKFDILSNSPGDIQKWKDTTNKCNINVAHDILIENNILSYDVTLKDNNLELINGSSKVRSISSGFMMCKRLTIEKMQSAFPRSKYIDNTGFLKSEEQQYAYALFDNGLINYTYCSEDIVFCERWNNLNGSIWACISVNINLVDSHNFQGSFYNSVIQI